MRSHISYHPNTMLNFPSNLISSSAYDHATGNFIPWLLFFLQDIHIFALFLPLFVFIVIHSLRQKKHHGLPVWPVVGMLPSLVIGLRTDMQEWITDVLCNHNGAFRFNAQFFSSLNFVATADPRNLEHLLRTNFPNFPKGPFFQETVHDFLGNGIFSADDETWRQQRKTASIEFHSSKFRQLTVESVLDLVHSRLLPVLENSIEHSLPVDLQDILLRLTFDNVCMIAFGIDPGCSYLGLPEIPFAKAFEDAVEATSMRFVTPTCIWKAMRYFNLGSEKKLKISIKGVDEFADDVIRTRKKENDKKKRSDLLSVFMGLKDEHGEPFSDKFLRDICVNFILAGRDTSSVALTWFFWLLDQNPVVEERILAEICRIVGEREEAKRGELETPLVFRPEEIKKMEYLHAALSEALRLYPSLPVDNKEVVEDDIFPDGTTLKKGTRVIYSIYTMGRMEGIWGKDCREFKPERWLKDGQFVNESVYKFTAFNGGPRLCLGKDFAYYQMKFVAASIIYRYRVKVVENHHVVPKLAFTLYMKHGLKVNLYKRDDSELQKYLKIY